jgi:phosphate transport system substrate-binding protein
MKQSIILILFLFFFVCCKQKKTETDTLTSGIISLACADNFKNLLEAEIDIFGAHYPQAFVFPKYIPESEAIEMLIADSVRIAVTARDLNTAERKRLKKNQIVRKYIFAFEGIAIIVNKANSDTIILLPVLKKILTGEITEWKQINSASDLGTIRLFFESKETGILQYLLDSVTKTTENISPNLYAAKNIDELFDKITEIHGAIGIIGLNQLGNEATKNYKNITAKTRLVGICKDENAKPALPYAGNLHNGDYPLWRSICVLLSENRNGLPKGFCFFLSQEIGQKIILKAGLMPISDSQNLLIQLNEE